MNPKSDMDGASPSEDRAGQPLLAGHTVRLTSPIEEGPGTRIGRYKLLQRIGEGGCGVVYMAEQEEPVQRRVALKIIKIGMDTKHVVARFEAERQALAMMDHPNIAKVLDAGATATGRPYFVMELVRGIKITDYCDQNNLSTGERLDVFMQICWAIQHAHQKGIIHRDIKPSNILVTLHDGVPVPKVIDFGIAKATQGRLTDNTLFTAFEQFIGTPAYMSPEQAEMSGLDIDTRTDVYSLGVLLYELLTGRTPFDSKELLQVGLDALRKIIREKEPQHPSTRLSTMEAEVLTSTAAHRRTDAPKLVRLIRGDLDWIAMKALEKDRTRRYPTANALAADVQRYLKHEPITARPPSNLYRFQKTVRRNKLAFAVAAVTSVALVLGAVISSLQAIRANRAEKEARRERDAATQARQQAQAISRFLTEDLLYQATPDRSAREEAITVEQVLDRAARKLDENPDKEQEIEDTLRLAVGRTYLKLGQWLEAKRHFARAVALRQMKFGAQYPETLLAQKQVLEVVMLMNQFDEDTERLTRETADGLKRLIPQPISRGFNTNLYRAALDVESFYAWQLANRGQLEKAIQIQHQNVAAYRQAFGLEDLDTINEQGNLAGLLGMRGDYAGAEQLIRTALQSYERMGLADTHNAFMNLNNLANYRLFQGDAIGAETLLAEALPRCRRALSPEHPVTSLTQHRLARALEAQERLEEATSLARETLAVRQRVLLRNSGNTAYTLLVLGRVLVKRNQLDEAKSLLQQARAIFGEHYKLKPELVGQAENWLGAIALAQKNYDEAEALMLPRIEHLLTLTAEMAPNEQRDAVAHLVQLYQESNKPEKAAAWQRRLDALPKPTTAAKSRQPGSASSARPIDAHFIL